MYIIYNIYKTITINEDRRYKIIKHYMEVDLNLKEENC